MITDEEDPWANVPHAAPIESESANQPTIDPSSLSNNTNNFQQHPQGGGRLPPPKRKVSAFASFPNSPAISQSGLSSPAGEEDEEEEMEEGEEDAEWGSSRGGRHGVRTESTGSRWASEVRRRWGKVKKFAKGVNEL